MTGLSPSPPLTGRSLWHGVAAAFCANLVGIGLARFAYTPLLPAIIAAHWLEPAAAAYLGAVNLAGYLAGALAGRPLAAKCGAVPVLRAMLLLATAGFFACAWPAGFLWFAVWRFAAGLAGGALMVLAAPTVLVHLPAGRRGLAGGLIFTGVGAGVAASGTLVPPLLDWGLRQSWLGLGALSALLAGLAWRGWPASAVDRPRPGVERSAGPPALMLLYAEYGLNAAGWVPHMIFLVDFIARGLQRGLAAGAACWVLFGLGAAVGPVLAGHLGDRIGFRAALRLGFLLEIVAVLLPAWMDDRWSLMASSLVVGAFVTGTVPLILGRIHDLLPLQPLRQGVAWSRATVGFAFCQALAAYGLSYLFAASGGDYHLLFDLGGGAMGLALVLDLAGGMRRLAAAEAGPGPD